MPEVVFRLPYPPSVNGLYRNARKGRIKTDSHIRWLSFAEPEVMRQRMSQPRILGRYRIAIIVERKGDKRTRDIGNLEKAVSDLMVRMGIVIDDSYAEEIILCWGDVSGCEVRIRDFNEQKDHLGDQGGEPEQCRL